MHRIVQRAQLSPNVFRLVLEAPRVARVRRPGQFVIVRRAAGAERIPLTIADADPQAGTITLIVQAVGKSTHELAEMTVGEAIADVAGPLGHPTELLPAGHAVCVGGGVGTAVVLPIARALAEGGVRVTSIIGGRSREWVILEEELRTAGEVITCTDDGSYGRPGFVTEALRDVLAAGGIDAVYAVGPVPMMRAVAEMTRPLGVRTIVSVNPIMIDGTGMCGGCRVTVGGQVRYACVEGPEFDGHAIDFAELADRLTTYRSFEQAAMARHQPCRIGLPTPVAPAGTTPTSAAGTTQPVTAGTTQPVTAGTTPAASAGTTPATSAR
jgi:ferredoxin--NADP+ reductase